MNSDDHASVPDVPEVNRRHLLRGGAILAGAAGATVFGAALVPSSAQATEGDPLILGNTNASNFGTFLQIGGLNGSGSPALRLSNGYGPALSLEGSTRNENVRLDVGHLAGSPAGPFLGTTDGTTYLATGLDLDLLPLPVAFTPERLLDTRTTAGRRNIVASSKKGAVNPQGQLTAGSWIDIGVWPTDNPTAFEAAFVNLTATRGVKAGYLTAYPAGTTLPTTSTVNFSADTTIANGAFVATGESARTFAVRIYASQTAAVLLDVTGATVRANADLAPAAAKGLSSATVKSARKARMTRLARKPLGRRLGR